jgi:hypothetical protein
LRNLSEVSIVTNPYRLSLPWLGFVDDIVVGSGTMLSESEARNDAPADGKEPVKRFLWRGQRISPRGVGFFRTEGIITKQMDGGDPAYVRRAGLLSAILAHVRPRDEGEERFLRTSSFLSFSASEAVAKKYAAGRAGGQLVPCEAYDEDAVIYRLDTLHRAQLEGNGLCELIYDCDYSLSRPISRDPLEEGTARAVRCEYCLHGKRQHRVFLVDVAEHLRCHPAHVTRADALDSAERDEEWLVYPTDYVARLKGFQSRVPLARIWNAFGYQLSSVESESK